MTGNAARVVWPDISVGMCYAHVYINVENKVKSFGKRNEILDDLAILQSARSASLFEQLGDHFLQKYKSDETSSPEVLTWIESFEKEWLTAHSAWFEGFSPFASHNNGLEAYNWKIKDEGTFRDRLPLLAFFEAI